MEKISPFFRNIPEPRTHATERGDLMDFFISHVNPSRLKIGLLPMTFARMGKELEGIPTKLLYTIKSSMDDGMRRGIPGGAAFWTALRSIRPKPGMELNTYPN